MKKEKKSMIRTEFENEYYRLLAIADHLRECDSKYMAYKNHTIRKDLSKEKFKEELMKELFDLFILLEIEVKNDKELYIKRLDKFIENISNE